MNGKHDTSTLDSELSASLAALSEIQASLAHLDIDPADEEFDWNKLNIASILKVMDSASSALDEVERRTDSLNAKLDALLAEGEEAQRRLEEAKRKDGVKELDGVKEEDGLKEEKEELKEGKEEEKDES